MTITDWHKTEDGKPDPLRNVLLRYKQPGKISELLWFWDGEVQGWQTASIGVFYRTRSDDEIEAWSYAE